MIHKEHLYNWVVDELGSVRVNIESPSPYGRTYENGYVRPEDNSQRKAGTTEKDGHVSTLGGGKGRIERNNLYIKVCARKSIFCTACFS